MTSWENQGVAGLTVVRLSPDYSAPSPLWPGSDETDALVPASLLAKLVAWQEYFDSNFIPETGWCSDDAKVQWANTAVELEAELREVLAGRADLVVDLWPLEPDLKHRPRY